MTHRIVSPKRTNNYVSVTILSSNKPVFEDVDQGVERTISKHIQLTI